MRLTPAERRRSQRIHIQIPMFVRGTDTAGLEFLDLTKTLDISATGACLASPRAVRANQMLRLTIPAPSTRSASLPSEMPPIRARVRRHRAEDGIYLLGVEFLKSLE
jgi:c-di-GMP-binding flagellar brake protein YcgR